MQIFLVLYFQWVLYKGNLFRKCIIISDSTKIVSLESYKNMKLIRIQYEKDVESTGLKIGMERESESEWKKRLEQ